MDAASPEKPMLTVALDVASAHVLADQAAIIQDLQFVMDSCKRLLTELAKPEEDRDPLLPLAIWSSAVVTYARCFGNGKRSGLTTAGERGADPLSPRPRRKSGGWKASLFPPRATS